MTPLIVAGLELMLIGMGTVFLFLTLLVIATTLMSRIISSIAPLDETNGEAGAPSAQEIAAISAAVAQYRRRRRGI